VRHRESRLPVRSPMPLPRASPGLSDFPPRFVRNQPVSSLDRPFYGLFGPFPYKGTHQVTEGQEPWTRLPPVLSPVIWILQVSVFSPTGS
jgi:hypothetical protein